MRVGLSLLAVFFLFAASAQAEIRYTASSLRDPFSEKIDEAPIANEATLAEEKLKGLTVQGMAATSRNTYAIINNKIYRVGNLLETGKITNIDKQGVTVMLGDKEIRIPLTKRKTAHEALRKTAK